MKSTLLIVAFLFFTISNFSQTQRDSLQKAVRERIKDSKELESDNPFYTKEEIEANYISENAIFQSLAQPNENSDLSKHFKIYLNQKLIRKIDFYKVKSSHLYKDVPSKIFNNTIRLTFEIGKKGNASNIHIFTGNSALDKEVIAAFKKYPIEKLALSESDKSSKISIQVFAKEDKNVIIKASSFIVTDHFPIIKNCENLPLNWQINKCFYDKLYSYILENISLKNINEQKLRGEILFHSRFVINAEGKVEKVNCIAPNKAIKDEIDRVLKLFDQVLVSGKRNGKSKNTYCDFYQTLTIESLN